MQENKIQKLGKVVNYKNRLTDTKKLIIRKYKIFKTGRFLMPKNPVSFIEYSNWTLKGRT